MCDVPSIAAFWSESIECFPGTASKFFLKLLVTIPVAPIITGMIVHFRFHIRCIIIIIIVVVKGGLAVAHLVGACATSRKVVGSIPYGVIGIFH